MATWKSFFFWSDGIAYRLAAEALVVVPGGMPARRVGANSKISRRDVMPSWRVQGSPIPRFHDVAVAWQWALAPILSVQRRGRATDTIRVFSLSLYNST
jgi:hypothetical protein